MYILYRWEFSPFGLAVMPRRGRTLQRFPTLAELKESATRRARLAGYYDDDDWMYLFDWEKARRDGTPQRQRPSGNQHPARSDRKKR